MSKLSDMYFWYLSCTTAEDRFEDSDFAILESEYADEVEFERQQAFHDAGGGSDN